MNDPLAEKIKQYYFDNLSALPPEKQFHFASRLYAWQNDPRAYQLLQDLKPHMTLAGRISDAFARVIDAPIGNVYGKKLRQVYFNKYPRLFPIHNALFLLRHLKQAYDIDAKKEFLELISENEMEELYRALTADDTAFRILSRFAVDFVFIYEILFDKPQRFDPQRILSMAKGFNLSDVVEKHLFVYLFTHSIIADSNFYVRQVPDDRLSIYKQMLEQLEELVGGNDMKFDTKFEFLVCCRICELDSPLFAKFNSEAANSISPHGTFIVDRLVGDPDAGLNQLARSEHRNVLFIMSQSSYRV